VWLFNHKRFLLNDKKGKNEGQKTKLKGKNNKNLMINYPVKSDVLLFLRHLVASLQPFAQAHSVALSFECDKETLLLTHHPETVASDVLQLLCRVVTFTPQNQRVKLSATLHDEGDTFYLKLVVENTGVNISRVKEIALNMQNPVIVHADRDKSTAYEIHWYLEKPLEAPPSVSTEISHPPDNVRNFYAAVRNRLSSHFKKQENRLAILAEENPKDAVFLQKVITVIHAHIGDETFDVEQLARSMAISRMQLHRKLKPLVHLSPVHYIRDVRLIKAKEMIEKEDLTIGEICFQLGFQSQSYFTRAFVEKYGVRPTAYRHKGQ
jgi:AraC-like DNA-binding protein